MSIPNQPSPPSLQLLDSAGIRNDLLPLAQRAGLLLTEAAEDGTVQTAATGDAPAAASITTIPTSAAATPAGTVATSTSSFRVKLQSVPATADAHWFEHVAPDHVPVRFHLPRAAELVVLPSRSETQVSHAADLLVQLGLTITLAPARHFSGRRFDNRNSTLWGSWVLKMPGFSLFFNGDSGYGRHFAEIGRRYGPFDVALMENGAYNERWAFIHMQPEQSVQAVQDVRARQVVPIHWGKLDLAFHPWKEPIRRFMAEADRKGVDVVTPEIGQVFDFAEPPRSTWWESAR